MNISSSQINGCSTVTPAYKSAAKAKDADASRTSKNRDTFEISNAGHSEYTQNAQAEQPYAVSGNETLKITQKDSNSKKFVIHFDNSAQLAKIVENGYICVNNVRVELSGSIKKLLTSADNAVNKCNELAGLSRTMRENIEAAQNQSEASEEFFDKMNKAFEIANRIANGGKVPPDDEKLLMDINPELYMMSMIAATMAKQHKKYETLIEEEKQQRPAPEEVSEITAYETQLSVSLDGTPSVKGVSCAEIHK